MKRSALSAFIRGKKFLLLPLLLVASSFASVTITGHVKVGDTTAPATNVSKIRMQLMYCVQQGQNTPRVIGTGALISPQFDITPSSDGSYSFTSYGNDVITCDTAGNSRWRVIMIYKNGQQSYNEYQVPDGGTFNLDTASTSSSGATAYTPTAVLTNPAGAQTITQPNSGAPLNVNFLNCTGTCTGFSSSFTLNGLSGSSQTFATDALGSDFGIASLGSTHTFSLPTASATKRGALSSADWSAFNAKQAAIAGNSLGANIFATSINAAGTISGVQPAFSNLSGSIAIGQTPLTTRGDLMTVNSGGALARLAIGGANTLLHGGSDPAYSAVAIGDVTGSSGTGNFLFATSPTATNATVNQAADGNNLLFGQRFTDTSPTGNLIYFKNAANNADLFKLDVAGQMFHSNHDLFATDNNFDIGASGANRPRSIYVGTTLFLAAGSSGTPALSFGANGSFYSSGSNSLTFASGGADRFAIGSFGAWLRSNTTGFGYSSVDTTGSFDTALKYGGAAQTWQFALAPNGTPKAYTVQFGESSRNGTDSNIAGGDATIRAGAGTGTGGGGAWHIQTAPTGSTGTTQNTFGDVLTISANQHVKFASNAAPSITAGCGTSPSVAGSDNVMQVNVGTGGTATTCTVTFAKAYVAAPLCFANDEGRTTPITRAVGSTTTVVIDTSSAWTASSKIDVACYGN